MHVYWTCLDCDVEPTDWPIHDSEMGRQSHTEHEPGKADASERFIVCPRCRSEEVIEVAECETCGKWCSHEQFEYGYTDCMDCREAEEMQPGDVRITA